MTAFTQEICFLLIKITLYQLLGGFVSLLLKLHNSLPFIGVHYDLFYGIVNHSKSQLGPCTITFPERNGDPNDLTVY